jgi:hypothetical protein
LDRGADETVTVYGSGYKKEYWYWEILVLLRKIAVTAISSFYLQKFPVPMDLQVSSSQYHTTRAAGYTGNWCRTVHPTEAGALRGS